MAEKKTKCCFSADDQICTLLISGKEDGQTFEETEVVIPKQILIDTSAYFNGIFTFLDSNVLNLSLPFGQNFVEHIIPLLLSHEHPQSKNSMHEEHVFETVVNARVLGTRKIYQDAIACLAEKLDFFALKEKFNPRYLQQEDLEEIFRWRFYQTKNECPYLVKLEKMLQWTNGFLLEEENDFHLIQRIRRFVDEILDVSKVKIGDYKTIEALTVKYPVVFDRLVSAKKIVLIYQKLAEHKEVQPIRNEAYIVSGAGWSEINGSYFRTEYKCCGQPIYVATDKSEHYALFYTFNNWYIGFCQNILEPNKECEFYYYVPDYKNMKKIPLSGWKNMRTNAKAENGTNALPVLRNVITECL